MVAQKARINQQNTNLREKEMAAAIKLGIQQENKLIKRKMATYYQAKRRRVKRQSY